MRKGQFKYSFKIGQVFNRLTVIDQAPMRSDRKRMALCRCSCGKTITVDIYSLFDNATKSCGCYHSEKMREIGGQASLTHGETRSSEWVSWQKMKERCKSPSANRYHRYGGRGITVCERWINSFENFLLDMGRKPSPLHSIGRIDNDGNYEPSNCKWESPKEQSRNRSNSVLLTLHGETKSFTEWCEHYKADYHRARSRIKRGWPIDERIFSPPDIKYRNKVCRR